MGSPTRLISNMGRPNEQILFRPRLQRVLDLAWERGLVTITGAAGWGKSTLLYQFCHSSPHPFSLVRADSPDTSIAGLSRSISIALNRSLGTPISVAESAEELVQGIIHATAQRTHALVLDDIHNISSSPAIDVLRLLVDYPPPGMVLVLASRSVPELDLSRRRLSNTIMEIGPNDLRFRTWEVERLFSDLYHEHLRPEEIATISARLGGWAAGLHLFHLGTVGKPPSSRMASLGSFGSGKDACHEYLTLNVLDSLPNTERHLLVQTSVMGVLSSAMCDEILGSSDSRSLLESLDRRNLISADYEASDLYRCHEVLRSHLESHLVDEVGPDRMRERYRQAAELLAVNGHSADAVRAFCRAGDTESAVHLLNSHGQAMAESNHMWWDSIPSAILDHDPWILLARARRAVSMGDLKDAIALYHSSRANSVGRGAGPQSVREQRCAEDWVGRPLRVSPEWTGRIRSALQRDPLSEAIQLQQLDTPTNRFAGGVAFVLSGHAHSARTAFNQVVNDKLTSDVISLAARIGIGIAGLLLGDFDSDAMELLAREADLTGQSHLARLASAVATTSYDKDPFYALPDWPHAVSDRWVYAVALCVLGLRPPSDQSALQELTDRHSDAVAMISPTSSNSGRSSLRPTPCSPSPATWRARRPERLHHRCIGGLGGCQDASSMAAIHSLSCSAASSRVMSIPTSAAALA